MFASSFAEVLVQGAAAAVVDGRDLIGVLEALPAPIYVTDSSGVVTFFNRACIEFAGRTPEIGKDVWCVTRKLYTQDGEPLAHDACPMAVAIRTRRPIRGVTAVAERPNGDRVSFIPLPTPVFGENMLIDITEHRQAVSLREEAHRCRRLASGLADGSASRTLNEMADEYDAKARELAASLGERLRLVA